MKEAGEPSDLILHYQCAQAPPCPYAKGHALGAAPRAMARDASSPLSITFPAASIVLKSNRSGVISMDIKLLFSSLPAAKNGESRSRSPRRGLLPAPETKYCTPCCGLMRS